MARLLKKLLLLGLLVCCLLLFTILAGAVAGFTIHHRIVNAGPGKVDTQARPGNYGKAVNPFIGTGGYFWVCGQNCPGPSLPFSIMRLGPETASVLINRRGFNSSGYYYADNKIVGFSHTRLIGTGAWEGGNCLIVPTLASRAEKAWRKGEFLRFSHAQEVAFPGYYAVELPAIDALAELTVTPRVGFHRYTFRGEEQPHILLDAGYVIQRGKVEYAELELDPEAQEITGAIQYRGTFSGRYGGTTLYFVARFDQPFAEYALWENGRYLPQGTSCGHAKAGADLAFTQKSIQLKLAISYVSLENARENMTVEADRLTFDTALEAAKAAWEKKLALIDVKGGSEAQRSIFYTALYRTLQMPTVYTDVNRQYQGFDKRIHEARDFEYYTDLSLWDTFRNVHSLYNLIAPQEQRDMMVSLLTMAQQGTGFLPRWPSGHGYAGSMLGSPANIVMAEAWLKGIRGFDIEAAYAAMCGEARNTLPKTGKFSGRGDMEDYLNYGYIPDDLHDKSVGKTVEYAWADYCIARLAEALDRPEDRQFFDQQAQNYKNVWNPETRFFHPRNADGAFTKAFKPTQISFTDYGSKYTKGYVEGSAWQWRWAAPFDPQGMIQLFGGPEAFVKELEYFFHAATPKRSAVHPGSYYWHGNEPDIHAAYLFNEAGRPDLCQYWVRWILNNKYGDRHEGLDGNDDGGALSAWYVFSALGFYPLPGTTKYYLGAPLFEEASIRLGDKTLRIIADNFAPDRFYVRQVRLNGRPLENPWFFHADIAEGGELRFEMTDTAAPPAA